MPHCTCTEVYDYCSVNSCWSCSAVHRIPWDSLLLRAPPEERLADVEAALGELEFRQHAQRFTRLWAAMRSAEQAAAAAGVLH